MRGIVAGSLLVGIVAMGCGRDDRSPPDAPASPRTRSCRSEFLPPAGFALVETERVRQIGHVGVRESFEDPEHRLLHLTSGIVGEFGEGAPGVGTFVVETGDEARLIGKRPDWVLVWEEDRPCSTQTIAGHGFDRRAFLSILQEMGVLHSHD